MIKKGTDKYINKISSSPSLYEMQKKKKKKKKKKNLCSRNFTKEINTYAVLFVKNSDQWTKGQES